MHKHLKNVAEMELLIKATGIFVYRMWRVLNANYGVLGLIAVIAVIAVSIHYYYNKEK